MEMETLVKASKNTEWTRLDNASKVFPATSSQRDAKVFRIACELFETVDPKALQEALDATMVYYPLYQVVLRRGFFWYYLEATDLAPVVAEESLPVCAPIYRVDRRDMLFRVFYFNNRINLEIFHALSDGTGALWFMETLVQHYLTIVHRDCLPDLKETYEFKSSVSKQKDDSFDRHFRKGRRLKRPEKSESQKKNEPAYQIRGTRRDEHRISLIEGSMSATDLLAQSHANKTTLTIFLASVFMYAIYKEMPHHRINRPVVLSIPVDLRLAYGSTTARNFFTTIKVEYSFASGTHELGDVIRGIAESFRQRLSQDQLDRQLKQLMSLEKNPFMRILPLPLKDLSLRIATKIRDRRLTSTLSNVGRIQMPTEFQPYIRQFGISTSATKPKITMCSFGDRTVISFTSPYQETDVERTFFNLLEGMGLEIEIASNR